MSTHITHIAVYVRDLEKSRVYYTTYFNGISNDIYRNTSGFSSYFITFDSGARLELMHHRDLKERLAVDKVTGWNHVAFSVGNQATVLSLTEKIVAAGYEVYSSPRKTGDGYFESCVADPDGNRVEITE